MLVTAGFVAAGTSATAGEPLPATITEAPLDDIAYADVAFNIDAYLQNRVRWGGEILAIEPSAVATRLTLRLQPLTDTGQPDYQKFTTRKNRLFIVDMEADSDPSLFAEDRLVTVYGSISGKAVMQSDELPVPVVEAVDITTWASAREHASANAILDEEQKRDMEVTVGFGIGTHGSNVNVGVKGGGEKFSYEIKASRSSSDFR